MYIPIHQGLRQIVLQKIIHQLLTIFDFMTHPITLLTLQFFQYKHKQKGHRNIHPLKFSIQS